MKSGRRDPLAVLQRLRGLEVEAARRALGERLGAQARAEARAAEASAALPREALAVEAGADRAGVLAMVGHAAWLPEALRQRAVAEDQAAGAAALAETARRALAEARAAERAVEKLREARAAEREVREERAAAAVLDEAGLRRR